MGARAKSRRCFTGPFSGITMLSIFWGGCSSRFHQMEKIKSRRKVSFRSVVRCSRWSGITPILGPEFVVSGGATRKSSITRCCGPPNQGVIELVEGQRSASIAVKTQSSPPFPSISFPPRSAPHLISLPSPLGRLSLPPTPEITSF
jgi:hypothetical protein